MSKRPITVFLPPPVLGLILQRAGTLKGMRLAGFVSVWLLATHYLGDEHPGTEDVIAWFEGSPSRATSYRRLAEFRAALPELGADAVPTDWLRVVWDEKEPRAIERPRRASAPRARTA